MSTLEVTLLEMHSRDVKPNVHFAFEDFLAHVAVEFRHVVLVYGVDVFL